MNRAIRTLVLSTLTLTLVAMVAGPSQGQQNRRSWRMYGDSFSVGVALLQIEKIQQELKLNDDQVSNAKEMDEKLSRERRALYTDLSREEMRERGDELRKKTAEMAKTAAMSFAESLDDAQKKRWLEVTLQARGAAALPGEYLAEQLHLDAGQINKLNELDTQYREKRFEMFQQARDQGLSREASAEKFTALINDTNKERMSVLTAEQRDAFEKMQGEKFELPE